MTTALVWLRRDLRLHDNPALARAAAEHDSVIPVYLYAPQELAPWAPGAAARWWLHYALQSLHADLRKRRSRLILRNTDNSVTTLRALARESGADAVYWNRLYEPATIKRDTAIKQALNDDGLQTKSFNAALLWEPWQIKTQSGGPYRVFTPFWKACRDGQIDTPLAVPKPLPGAPSWPASEPLEALQLLPKIAWDKGLKSAWEPSETGAHQRLADACDQIVDDYATTRNLPALDGTSRLSPYLHHGQLSPRQVWHAIADRYRGKPLQHDSAQTLLSEIAWREFAYYALYHFPTSAEQPVREKFQHYPWRQGKEQQRLLRAWQRGRTGVPLVDAGMRQLWQCGWMHNRVRMVVASFLTKNCRIHWLEGARWFWDTLVDADLASNSMGWQWTAGSGFDAAPYFRVFNPVRQSERFDPDGEYLCRWVPELADLTTAHRHQPWLAKTAPTDYPSAPIVDLAASRRAALMAYQDIK